MEQGSRTEEILGKPVTMPAGDLEPSIDFRMPPYQLKMLVPVMLLRTITIPANALRFSLIPEGRAVDSAVDAASGLSLCSAMFLPASLIPEG